MELEISEEQYANSCLHQKRSMLSVSIIKNIIVFLYFFFLYGGIRFLEHINTMWDAVKDNSVIIFTYMKSRMNWNNAQRHN